MASKGSPRSGSKGKNSKPSPSKKPATTITALFKKQLQQQKAECNKPIISYDQESDIEAVQFVKEEQTSVFFKSDESQNKSFRDVDEKGDADRARKEADIKRKDLSDNKDLKRTDKTQTRLSRRLSLKKANHDEKNVEKLADSGCGNEGTVSSSKLSKYTCADACSVKVLGAGSACSGSKGVDCGDVPLSSITGEAADDASGGNTECSDLSTKSKLSLKRKRTSEENTLKSPVSKVKKLESKPELFQKGGAHVTDSSAESTKQDKTFLLSSHQQSLEGVVSSENDFSMVSTKVDCENEEELSHNCSESAASSSSETYKPEMVSKEKQNLEKAKTGKQTKNKVKGRNSSATNSVSKELTESKHIEESEEVNEAETTNEEILYRVPYYLENFNTIMKSVFADDYYVKLFNQSDLKYVEDYNNLSDASQKLYVRLFSRKLAWLPSAKIKYPEIADDLTSCLEELIQAQLLSSGTELDELSAVLGAISAPDLRTLAKTYHVNPAGQQKGQIIETLLAKGQQSTVASLFGQKIGGVKTAMLKRAKAVLGAVYRLYKEPRAVFVRAMMLFSLINTNGDEENGNGGQGQLFQMLMVNMGRVVYPTYTVNRQTQIFSCRQDLIRFEEALQLETELLGYTTSGNWASAYTSFLTVKDRYEELVKDNQITEWDRALPEFLRYYTAGSVLVRLLNQGIEILQRRKEYTAAVTLIRDLLGQSVYNLDFHGYWWDRLALNLDVHLKRQEEALQAIQDGLSDPLVRTGHRLSLFLRAETICSKPKSPYSRRLKDFCHESLTDLPKVTIEGRVLPHSLPGSRYQFITHPACSSAHDEEVTMCNVEQIVLDHYALNGFPQGIHAEGSVVSTLFCLFFWELLFMDVPDAFHSSFQTCPLDLHTDAFYSRRQSAIDLRLSTIEDSDVETLHSMMAAAWNDQHGVMCAGISWDRFSSIDDVQGLVSCMGGRVVAGILRRYAQQPRHTRSGFPDLTLWNTATKQLKISEVKGPGDRLSHKQMLWLNYLLKLGVDAEVSHVKPVGVKKLKPAEKMESPCE